jgi:hypothetical protein
MPAALPIGPFGDVGVGDILAHYYNSEEAGQILEPFVKERPYEDSDDWQCTFDWVMEETGGEGEDASVLVDGAAAWGVDYEEFPCPVLLFHGDADVTVPIDCAEWLLDQLPPSSVLVRVREGEHDEVMLRGVWDALRVLDPASGPFSSSHPSLALAGGPAGCAMPCGATTDPSEVLRRRSRCRRRSVPHCQLVAKAVY